MDFYLFPSFSKSYQITLLYNSDRADSDIMQYVYSKMMEETSWYIVMCFS